MYGYDETNFPGCHSPKKEDDPDLSSYGIGVLIVIEVLLGITFIIIRCNHWSDWPDFFKALGLYVGVCAGSFMYLYFILTCLSSMFEDLWKKCESTSSRIVFAFFVDVLAVGVFVLIGSLARSCNVEDVF